MQKQGTEGRAVLTLKVHMRRGGGVSQSWSKQKARDTTGGAGLKQRHPACSCTRNSNSNSKIHHNIKYPVRAIPPNSCAAPNHCHSLLSLSH